MKSTLNYVFKCFHEKSFIPGVFMKMLTCREDNVLVPASTTCSSVGNRCFTADEIDLYKQINKFTLSLHFMDDMTVHIL